MDITKFETEHFFGPYEFSVPHLLSCSDCETVSIAELLELAGIPLDELGCLGLQYTESPGNPQLRHAIASSYEGVAPEDVLVLGSPIEGIYITMRALLEPADEVVVLSPCYDALFHVAQHICATVHRFELGPSDDGWTMDLHALEKLLSSRTKLVVVNFPHNPTGFHPSPDQFEALSRLVDDHGARLFCDEMYRGLEFGSAPTLRSAAEQSDRSIVLAGLSKAHGLPGLRAGWLVTRDARLREKLINWKFYTSICAPAPSEFLATAAVRAREALIGRARVRVRENVRRAEEFFGSARGGVGFTWRPPQAGSVALLEVQLPADIDGATAWCHQLAANPGVLLLPGSCMGTPDRFVRLGFGRVGFAEALDVLGGSLASE